MVVEHRDVVTYWPERYLRLKYTTNPVANEAPKRLHMTMAATSPPLRPSDDEDDIVVNDAEMTTTTMTMTSSFNYRTMA